MGLFQAAILLVCGPYALIVLGIAVNEIRVYKRLHSNKDHA